MFCGYISVIGNRRICSPSYSRRSTTFDSCLCGGDDYKRTGHDAALRVPLVIAGGPFEGGRVVEELVSTESIPKTILSLAGIDVADEMIGEDLLDILRGKTDGRKNQVYAQISESRVGRCIRTPEYLYAVYAPGIDGGSQPRADVYADDYLYDLNRDSLQLQNVAADETYSEVKKMLRRELLDWIRQAEGYRPVITD